MKSLGQDESREKPQEDPSCVEMRVGKALHRVRAHQISKKPHEKKRERKQRKLKEKFDDMEQD
jgi:hypothetical protein